MYDGNSQDNELSIIDLTNENITFPLNEARRKRAYSSPKPQCPDPDSKRPRHNDETIPETKSNPLQTTSPSRAHNITKIFDVGSTIIVHDETGATYHDASSEQKRADVLQGLSPYADKFVFQDSEEMSDYMEPPNWCYEKSKVPVDPVAPTLTKEQQDLVDLIVSGQNVFYTGSAGCGKSTVLKEAVKQLKDLGRDVHIVAPSGPAAIQVNGTTIHNFMSWTLDHFKKPLKVSVDQCWNRLTRRRLQRVDVLIFDEISMVENHLFERVNLAMKELRYLKSDSRTWEAFGGCQVIVTGDFCQLAPVKTLQHCLFYDDSLKRDKDDWEIYDCVKKHGPWSLDEQWAFASRAWKECEFNHVSLRQIHRQNDPQFLHILEKLRIGKFLTIDDKDFLVDYPCDVRGATHIYPKNEDAHRANKERFARLPTRELEYECLDTFEEWKYHANHRQLAARCNDRTLEYFKNGRHKFGIKVQLKKGMQVILQINLDLKRGLCNGSQGVIVGFEKHNSSRLPMAAGDGMCSDVGCRLLYGDNSRFKEQQIRLFAQKQGQGVKWPVVRFPHSKITRTIYPECLTNDVCSEPGAQSYIVSCTQVPLTMGWAVTIHRSQGMTLEKAIVDLSKAFAPAQPYVALSRVRSPSGLEVRGDRSGLEIGEGGDPEVQEFMRKHDLLPEDDLDDRVDDQVECRPESRPGGRQLEIDPEDDPALYSWSDDPDID